MQESNDFQKNILRGLNVSSKHIYGGTVPKATVDKRRAKNRVAKKSRRRNRG